MRRLRPLMSGLKLLNTVLPLKEAVVFPLRRLRRSQTVVAFQRPCSQHSGSTTQLGLARRHQALPGSRYSRKLVSQTTRDKLIDRRSSSASRKRNCRCPAHSTRFGVLGDDAPLLEAVGSQFARNLERESFSSRIRAHAVAQLLLSNRQQEKDRRTKRAQGSTVEQRCEASTLTHIDDGIAIAYLDGTLALVNPTLLRFAGLTSEQVSKWIFSTCSTSSALTFLTNLRSRCDECCKPASSTKASSTSNRRTRFSTCGSHCFVSESQTNRSASLSTLRI